MLDVVWEWGVYLLIARSLHMVAGPVTTRMTRGIPFFYSITWKKPANPGAFQHIAPTILRPKKENTLYVAITKGKNKSPSNECSKHFGSGTPQKNLNFFFFEAVPIFSRHTPSIETKWCSIDELMFTPKAQQVNVLPFKNITKERLFF